jgi:hypothetical protein
MICDKERGQQPFHLLNFACVSLMPGTCFTPRDTSLPPSPSDAEEQDLQGHPI